MLRWGVLGRMMFDDASVPETMMFDDACVPKEKSRPRPLYICVELILPKLEAVGKRRTDVWLAIIALSSPGDHEGEKDELLPACACPEAVIFRPSTAFGGGGIATWSISLSLAICKGGSLIDPRLSCDMYEEALPLR